jgi:predicted molibdopterin-dependent oxidoreductase YjgC
MLYEKAFPRGRATFRAVERAETAEVADASYPLILTTGRLQHYNCGSMSRCTDGLSVLCSGDRLEIHPHDAARLNVQEDQMVEVASRRGNVSVRARLSDLCSPGVVFLSFHFEETPTNQLTGDILDPMACTPDYKVTAVRLTSAR